MAQSMEYTSVHSLEISRKLAVQRRKQRTTSFVYHLVVLFFAFVMIYPLLWMVNNSFRDSVEIIRSDGTLTMSNLQPLNYVNGWKGFGGFTFRLFFGNSFLISILATIGAVASAAVVGFGFARTKFRGKSFWFACMLLSMMIPFQVIMIPQYILFNTFGWVGSFLPLIVPHFFGQGFFIFLNVQFIKGIPIDLDEAAKIDGCSILRTFLTIILPLIKPALVTTALFSFMWRWDDFLAALLYLNKPSRYPVSLALKMFSDPSAQSDWGAMFAMATLSLVPIFIIFGTMQRYLVEGIAATGIKE